MAMMRCAVLAACVAGFPGTAAVPQEEPRQASLTVVTKVAGKRVELKGQVDMPEGTLLDLYLQREPETLLYGRTDSRLEPALSMNPDKRSVAVERDSFSAVIELPGSGFYRVAIMYSQFAQRDEAVLKALGGAYTDWTREVSLPMIDARTIAATLAEEHARLRDVLSQLAPLADAVEQAMRVPRDQRDWKPFERQIDALEKRLEPMREGTLYTATHSTLMEALQRIRQCAPQTARFELPPGVTKEHIEAEMGEVPMGFSDETDVDSVRLFLSRATRCVDRERLLVTLRYAAATWEPYLAAIGSEKSSEQVLDAAKETWERAMQAVAENSRAIEAELPDKKKRRPEDEVLASWAHRAVEVVEQMNAYGAKRRGAREESAEERERLETRDLREARQAFETLNNTLRRVPSR